MVWYCALVLYSICASAFVTALFFSPLRTLATTAVVILPALLWGKTLFKYHWGSEEKAFAIKRIPFCKAPLNGIIRGYVS